MVNILQMTFSNPSMHHDTPIITFLHNLTSFISESHTAQKILACLFILRPPTKWPAFCNWKWHIQIYFLASEFWYFDSDLLFLQCWFVSWMDSITVVSHAHHSIINHWQLNFCFFGLIFLALLQSEKCTRESVLGWRSQSFSAQWPSV